MQGENAEGATQSITAVATPLGASTQVSATIINVGLLEDPYIKGDPLPRIPSHCVPVGDSQLQKISTAACLWSCTIAHVPGVASTTRLSLIKCVIQHLHCRLITKPNILVSLEL